MIQIILVGIVAHACNPSTWEMSAGVSEVQNYCLLHSKQEASMDQVRPFSVEQNTVK